MAKKTFRKDTKSVKRFDDGGVTGKPWQSPTGTVVPSSIPAPDPNSVNAGFGSPSSSQDPAFWDWLGKQNGSGPQATKPQPSALQALAKKLGPYASIGMIAGGMGGKAGIIAAPLAALGMEALLKQQSRRKSGAPSSAGAATVPSGSVPDIDPALGYAKGGQIKETKMRREFRSNGPKVTNLTVSPRKAMGMKMMSPESIPTLKKGGKVQSKFDIGGMVGGDGSGRFLNRLDTAVQNHPQWGQQFMANHPQVAGMLTNNDSTPTSAPASPVSPAAAPAASSSYGSFKKGGKIPMVKDLDHDGMKKGGACGKAKGGSVCEDRKDGSDISFQRKGGKVSKFAKGGLIPNGTNMTTRGSKGAHFD